MRWGEKEVAKTWTEVKFAWVPTKMSAGYWVWFEVYQQDYRQFYGTIYHRWWVKTEKKWQTELWN